LTKARDTFEVTDARARKTTLLVGGVLLLLGGWNYYRGRLIVVAVLGALGVALALTGLLLPALARRFHVYWMRLATALGNANSRIMLALMFYLVFTPYNLVLRLFGRDPLNRRGPSRESYWVPRKATRQSKEQFERLF
jgi:hypothetical protein